MYSLALLALFAAQNKIDTTPAYEGVWVDPRANLLFVGNGRLDWQVEDRYFSAHVDQVPDGTLFGNFLAGREIYVRFNPMRTAADAAQWDNPSSGPFSTHLVPDMRTFSKPQGEVRLTTKTAGGNGLPTSIDLDATPAGTRVPNKMTFVRALPMSSVTVAGKFGDKDVTVEIQDSPGRVGEIHGKIAYLGKPYSISGRRIMGRAGFTTFNDSRFGENGTGSVAFYPSMSRALDLRDRNSTETDQIAIFFRFADGSTASGIHKILKRLP